MIGFYQLFGLQNEPIFDEKKLDGDKRGAKGLGMYICMEGRESIHRAVCGGWWGVDCRG